MDIFRQDEDILGTGLNGVVRTASGELIRSDTEYGYAVFRKDLPQDRVRILLNGGGGTGYMWSACAEEGLADAVVHGESDSAPNAYVIYETAKTIDSGKGVLLLANNFMGDYLNDDMACELLGYEGIDAKMCLVSDDIRNGERERGGLSGILQVAKIASAASAAGMDLAQVSEIAGYANSRTRSLTSLIRQGNIELGPGFSGEPAIKQCEYRSGKEMVRTALDMLLDDFSTLPKKVYLSINPTRQVSFIEGSAMTEVAAEHLGSLGIEVIDQAFGTYFDVFDDPGAIFTLVDADDKLAEYIHKVNGKEFML